MILNLDICHGVEIHEQIVRQLKLAIAKGALRRGEQLPSQHQLARHLVLNPHAVSRAYRQLRDERIVDPVGDFGLQVSQQALPECLAARRRYSANTIRAAMSEVRESGLPRREAAELVDRELAAFTDQDTGDGSAQAATDHHQQNQNQNENQSHHGETGK